MATMIDRRAFLKAVGTAGFTTAMVSAAPTAALAAPKVRAAAVQHTAPPYPDAEKLLAAVPKERLLRTYTRMVLSRTWEEDIMRARMAGTAEIYGNWYPYIGEEAIASGIVCALNDDDFISMTHRAVGQYIAKGGDLKGLSAELFGSSAGVSKGYGGSLHVIDMTQKILGANGIVGGGWYTCFGSAFGAMATKSGQVSVTFAGDGACNSAYFFSAVRSAAMYEVPAIFVIENNKYQSTTMYRNCSPVNDLIDYVAGLPIGRAIVDGNDVAAVYAAAKAACDRGRSGGGPTVIEAKTYRWYHHSGFSGVTEGKLGAWNLGYRTDYELQEWMARDPIPRFQNFLVAHKMATAEELAAIDKAQKALVTEAIDYGKKAPKHKGEDALLGLYAKDTVAATQFFNRKGLAA